MSRELKFRFWNGKGIIFSGDTDMKYYLDPRNGRVTWLERYNDDDWGMASTSTWGVMQFTGLTDRNNKEVYEADLLRLDDGNVVTVYYAEAAAMFCIAREGEDIDTPEEPLWEAMLLPITTSKMPQVIGNIYENPELLNPNHKEPKES